MISQKERIYDIFSSHFYFIKKERAIWRNFASWNIIIEYVKFSDSTFWWFDDYDYHVDEWEVDFDLEIVYEIVTLIMKNYDEVSSNFEKYYLNENMLILLSKFTLKNVYFNFK
jgi:hypothetical protein